MALHNPKLTCLIHLSITRILIKISIFNVEFKQNAVTFYFHYLFFAFCFYCDIITPDEICLTGQEPMREIFFYMFLI